MKFIKNGLRTWIALTSVAGFLGGWAVFSHSNKPVSSVTQQPAPQIEAAPLPTLPPVPSLNNPIQQIQPIQPMPQFNTFSRRIRTGGS
jgi:hypothetical protein